ncbi:MAG: oligosaccharide flippase family protein [Gemmatimonadota bacterium]
MRIGAKALRGFFYTLASGYVARVASVALTFLIRRQLGPGVFANAVLGITLFMLLSSLREFGLPHALLHFQEQVEEFVGTHLLLNLALTAASSLLSCLVAGILWLCWPAVVSSTVAAVVCTLSALHLLRNATLTSESLLRLEFEFGRLSLYHGLATMLALGVALATARQGWGTWSLVLGGWSTFSVFSVVYVVVFSAGVWTARPLPLRRLSFSLPWARRLMRYGLWIWVGWMLQSFVWWYDKLAVRLLVGSAELALYENAWWLVQLPTAIITAIIFTYTNALYSRYQKDRQKLGQLFARMASLIVRVSSPLALVLVLNSREILAVIPEWLRSAPIIVWLAGYAFLRPLLDDGMGLLWAVGDTRAGAGVVVWQAAVAAVAVPAAGWYWGVNGVAASMGLVAAVGVVGLVRALRPHVDVAWGRVLAAPAVALLVSAAVALAYGRVPAPFLPGVPLVRSGLMLLAYGAVLLALERRRLVETVREALAAVRHNEGAGD